MEFNEKLQQLRKEKELTQEQLAAELFVSRTAISKWESGKGYPNIDSLKAISTYFCVSVDQLLSGEELISLAETENRNNIVRTYGFVFGIVDLAAIVLLFLPLYGQQDGDHIYMVTLAAFENLLNRVIYFSLTGLLVVLGIIELVVHRLANKKWLDRLKACSIGLHVFIILVFIGTRHPYPITLLFIFFIIKILLVLRSHRLRHR